MQIATILMLLAFLCFVLSAFGVTARVSLQSVGLALWVLALIIA